MSVTAQKQDIARTGDETERVVWARIFRLEKGTTGAQTYSLIKDDRMNTEIDKRYSYTQYPDHARCQRVKLDSPPIRRSAQAESCKGVVDIPQQQ